MTRLPALGKVRSCKSVPITWPRRNAGSSMSEVGSGVVWSLARRAGAWQVVASQAGAHVNSKQKRERRRKRHLRELRAQMQHMRVGRRVALAQKAPWGSKPPNEARQAIEKLLGKPPIPPAKLVALFEGRANWHLIRGWRYGSCKMPQWAADHVARLLKRQAEELLSIGAKAKAAGNPNGAAGNARALRAWRAQKARERDALLDAARNSP